MLLNEVELVHEGSDFLKSKKRIFSVLGICLLLLAGLLMFFNNKGVQTHFINASQEKVLRKANRKQIKNNEKKEGNYNPSDTSLANAQTVLKNRLKAENVQPLGVMTVPQIKMKNPILNGYGPKGEYLALGACTMKLGERMGQGNYSLAGHYMQGNTVFHSLSKIQPGMHVYVTDKQNIYDYQITSNQTVSHLDTSVINETTNPTITLITCVGLNQTPWRTCIKGNLVNTLPANSQNLKKYNLN